MCSTHSHNFSDILSHLRIEHNTKVWAVFSLILRWVDEDMYKIQRSILQICRYIPLLNSALILLSPFVKQFRLSSLPHRFSHYCLFTVQLYHTQKQPTIYLFESNQTIVIFFSSQIPDVKDNEDEALIRSWVTKIWTHVTNVAQFHAPVVSEMSRKNSATAPLI